MQKIELIQGLLPLIINTLGEIDFTIKGETTKALVGTGAISSVLNTTQLRCPLSQSKASVQMIGTSN